MRRISTGLSTEVPHAYHAVHLEDRFISAIQSLAKLATSLQLIASPVQYSILGILRDSGPGCFSSHFYW